MILHKNMTDEHIRRICPSAYALYRKNGRYIARVSYRSCIDRSVLIKTFKSKNLERAARRYSEMLS